jgi:hypothetical protein
MLRSRIFSQVCPQCRLKTHISHDLLLSRLTTLCIVCLVLARFFCLSTYPEQDIFSSHGEHSFWPGVSLTDNPATMVTMTKTGGVTPDNRVRGPCVDTLPVVLYLSCGTMLNISGTVSANNLKLQTFHVSSFIS